MTKTYTLYRSNNRFYIKEMDDFYDPCWVLISTDFNNSSVVEAPAPENRQRLGKSIAARDITEARRQFKTDRQYSSLA